MDGWKGLHGMCFMAMSMMVVASCMGDGTHGMSPCGVDEWSMVKREGHLFSLNGSPFYVNGFNAYYFMLLGTDASTAPLVGKVLDEAARAGLSVGRTMAFNDGNGSDALQTSPGVYNENAFEALDRAIDEARKRKIRLILNLVNNWNDYGGKQQYVEWGREAGIQNLISNDSFFSHPTIKNYYKNHVKAILTRFNTYSKVMYKDDPTIFAWELINEAQCPSDPSGNTLQAWVEEMAAYVKSIDPIHLLGVGTEGFYGPSNPDRSVFNPNQFSTELGTDFIRNNAAVGIDFATVHTYPDSWISQTDTPDYLPFVKNWTNIHIEDSLTQLNMPVLIEEFGINSHDLGYNQTWRQMIMEVVYEAILDSAKNQGSGAGGLFWQQLTDEMENFADGYEIILNQASDPVNALIYNQSRAINAVHRARCI
ncbi:mannan endo-1,4-beta-mannosidase 6 [Amborella trichopoda]|uniref:mannan endo-1,4-beta-mannosidase 6 n=1 Tax=Amborella trichopoda TaxID=13333 RepID=UPI0009BE3FB2|nr:mannan endo-1,4-beta-mannosidase 6 [Amborella trichopoda]|eukprot:XP_020521243.1 mannan endo-1,4-beta-mannosidase 6 [Amborella trichopoda]